MNISRKTLYISGAVTAVGLMVAILFMFVFGNSGSASGEIVLRPSEYDLENVPYEGGIVEREFTLENRGQNVLKINSIKTSCGCTEAQLVYKSDKSKKFGMHPNNIIWSQTIEPGDEAILRIFFDPTAHGPEGVGPFRRAVWLESSDPTNKKAEVRIEGTVVN